jgi:hypothetical protein
MKIISNFKDYYDSVGRYGFDESIKYIRRTESIEVLTKDYFGPDTFHTRGWNNLGKHNKKFEAQSLHQCGIGDISGRSYILGFCGSLYKCISLETIDTFKKKLTGIFYDKSSLKDWVSLLRDSKYKILGRDIVEIFNVPIEYESRIKEIFFKYKTPIFILTQSIIDSGGSHTLTINPSLKNFKFFQIKDPYSAFQEIQQYISGVLGVNVNPMATISNDSMIVKKGFDLKTSFRHPIKWKKDKKTLDKK